MPHRGGGTAGGGKGSSSVSFSQGREASFITKIKAQVGYKEHKVDVDAKRARPSDGNESEGDEVERPDDDAPTIVVLKEGDLTAEEVEAERQKQTKDPEAEEAMPADGKIKFKKPEKRKKEEEDKAAEPTSSSKDKPKKKKKVKSSLLSFGDDE